MKNLFYKLTIFSIILYTILPYSSTVYATTLEKPDDILEIPSLYDQIASESAILIDAKTGIIIFEKNKDLRLYPASITKIVTALVAIENTNNFNDRITMSHDAIFSLPPGTSNIAMNEDETLTMDEALYAVMLASANEVANAVAEHVGTTSEGFIEMMNDEVRRLNLKNTHFMNPHGLHDESHYTTARDMATIMTEAVKNPNFVKYINTTTYTIPPTEKQPEERVMHNSNKLIMPASQFYIEEVVGGKTGFTDQAMHTLVSYAKKDDKELIAVVLKGKKFEPYNDTKLLLDYGFNCFSNVEVFNKNDFKKQIQSETDGVTNGTANAYVNESLILDLPDTFDKTKVKLIDNLKDTYTEPITKGQLLGKLNIKYNNDTLKTLDIFADNDIMPAKAKKTPMDAVPTVISKDELTENLLVLGVVIIASLVFIFAILYYIIYSLSNSSRKKQSKINSNNFINVTRPTRKYRYKD